MPDPHLVRLLEQLRATRFADLAGARLSASIPISERLLNALVAASLPRSANVRDVTVHPRAGNRLTVRVRISRVDFLPPMSVTLAIDRQPELPDGPLVLRILSFPGLVSLLGGALPFAALLPPGVRMEKDRIAIDLRMIAERHGFGDLLPLVAGIRLATDEGALIVGVDVRVTGEGGAS